MKQDVTSHLLDNSALIHMAVHNKWHSNVFRIEVHLKSKIRSEKLQQAVDVIAARFPMLVAGIKKQQNNLVVVPCLEHLCVRADRQPLSYMPIDEIQNCATRVLYGEHQIAIECFHSLTDGAGGLQFLKALLSEYFDMPSEPFSLKDAWMDSYNQYATGSPTTMPGGVSYLFPSAPLKKQNIFRTTLTFSVKELHRKAKAEHTTITALFAALFAQTAMDMQRAEALEGKPLQPVQVMVPIDLRKRFSSTSLRNFSLYALPKLTPEMADTSFSEIVENIMMQLRAQSAHANLCNAIATNVELERKTAKLPLWMKCTALRTGFEVCGGRSSCITVSNLGQVHFPEAVQQEIEQLDFLLTPRAHSPYNCGIVSTGERLCLTITRRGEDCGMEKLFAFTLLKHGISSLQC